MRSICNWCAILISEPSACASSWLCINCLYFVKHFFTISLSCLSHGGLKYLSVGSETVASIAIFGFALQYLSITVITSSSRISSGTKRFLNSFISFARPTPTPLCIPGDPESIELGS